MLLQIFRGHFVIKKEEDLVTNIEEIAWNAQVKKQWLWESYYMDILYKIHRHMQLSADRIIQKNPCLKKGKCYKKKKTV